MSSVESGGRNETILEIIERRLVPDEQAKKARSEVFTPLALVREILYGVRKSDFEDGHILPWGVDKNNNISEDDEDDRIGGIPLDVWRDPDTKWLDPANGIGNFPFVAFHMLDYQLKHHGTKGSKEWTDEKRQKHIVEKMLYMIEIDRGNVNTTHKIMNFLVSGCKPNICCADTLKLKDDDLDRHFRVNRFDVVMGNPPFNAPLTRKHFTGKTPEIWDKFIEKSMVLIKNSGFLAFLTPPKWRGPDSYRKLWKIMASDSSIVFLRILNQETTMKMFNVNQRIDVYLIHKNVKSGISYIVDEHYVLNKLELSKFQFIPNYAFNEISKIMTDKDRGIKILYDTSYHSTSSTRTKPRIQQDVVYKYPVIHTINQAGIQVRYIDDNTRGTGQHFGVPKVILSKGRHQYPYNDFEGKYGMTEMSFAIPIQSKEEGDNIVRAINSDKFKEIIKATKWGAFYTNYHMFEYFKPDFYKEFLEPSEGAGNHKTKRNSRSSSRTTRRTSSHSST